MDDTLRSLDARTIFGITGSPSETSFRSKSSSTNTPPFVLIISKDLVCKFLSVYFFSIVREISKNFLIAEGADKGAHLLDIEPHPLFLVRVDKERRRHQVIHHHHQNPSTSHHTLLHR